MDGIWPTSFLLFLLSLSPNPLASCLVCFTHPPPCRWLQPVGYSCCASVRLTSTHHPLQLISTFWSFIYVVVTFEPSICCSDYTSYWQVCSVGTIHRGQAGWKAVWCQSSRQRCRSLYHLASASRSSSNSNWLLSFATLDIFLGWCLFRWQLETLLLVSTRPIDARFLTTFEPIF
jgi:hypothetical protein